MSEKILAFSLGDDTESCLDRVVEILDKGILIKCDFVREYVETENRENLVYRVHFKEKTLISPTSSEKDKEANRDLSWKFVESVKRNLQKSPLIDRISFGGKGTLCLEYQNLDEISSLPTFALLQAVETAYRERNPNFDFRTYYELDEALTYQTKFKNLGSQLYDFNAQLRRLCGKFFLEKGVENNADFFSLEKDLAAKFGVEGKVDEKSTDTIKSIGICYGAYCKMICDDIQKLISGLQNTLGNVGKTEYDLYDWE